MDVQLLDFATDDLSLRFGETIAGLFAFTLVELTAPSNAENCLLMSFRITRKCLIPILILYALMRR